MITCFSIDLRCYQQAHSIAVATINVGAGANKCNVNFVLSDQFIGFCISTALNENNLTTQSGAQVVKQWLIALHCSLW
jgi:hypothetical protein